MSKILIVEDEPMVALMLCALLHETGHTAESVGTCAAAREKMHNDYDIFILDLGLPDGDGKELAIEFRAAGITKPIVAFSGREEYEMEKPCLAAGMTSYVKKGNNALLLAKVEELLAIHAVA